MRIFPVADPENRIQSILGERGVPVYITLGAL